ncbi:hypothetical protein M9H77_28196 [Catharanthus roseus]|uniref:Uncharacterized protein n=2 Tax=Catharanthus roseus TaxID=4058 RepID=A0ACC0AIS2_CATRO|nr:hypothetical protein M9H77_28194 [Catharanthus roseus]KAI5659403.1 hypothetical protein M9H77_28196 [Catharanthus roseus]
MKVPFQGRTTYYDTSILSSPALVSGLIVSFATLRFTSFVRSRLLRFDLPSSSYRSYSHFTPVRCYDIPYSNSEDSRRSLALFTIAMIGVIVLTMHKTTKVKRQDVF